MTDQLAAVTRALAPRYIVERIHAKGGMAIVYLAEDVKHKRTVAVKVLPPELALDGVHKIRFLNEIKITATLNHPHILTLIDSGEADGLVYYVMPYVQGEGLHERLKREGTLSIEDALEITRDVASALGHAHGQGVIHRDTVS